MQPERWRPYRMPQLTYVVSKPNNKIGACKGAYFILTHIIKKLVPLHLPHHCLKVVGRDLKLDIPAEGPLLDF